MSKVEEFLTQTQEQQIVKAIRTAELHSSGEIRVHIENCTPKETLVRAEEVFHYLKMDETENKNGVLFYLAVQDKKFAVIGDKNIDAKVPNGFWESTKELVLKEFKTAHFASGLVKGILNVGKELKQYYPINENDTNELINTVSVGKK
ncbi:MAG: TPM domain-containing protein [Flavobacteriaceae bacterium]